MTEQTAHDATAQAADQTDRFTDARGRTIQLRILSPLQHARLVMAVGSQAAENDVFMNAFALPAAMVEKVDDDAYSLPGTLHQVEGVLAVLGSDGMAALNKHLYQKVEAARAKMQAGIKEEESAAKN